jgi:hypothetical protein
VSRLIRYVFFRLNRQQKRVTRDWIEAKHSAAIFMCLAPMSVMVLSDIVIADIFERQSLYEILGRWVFGLGLFAILYALHYFTLMRGGKPSAIDREFERDPYPGAFGTFVVASYLIAPPVLSVIVADFLRETA